MRVFNRLRFSLAFIALLGMITSCQSASQEQQATGQLPVPKNVIYFIGDGMGFNQVLSANYFEHGEAGTQVYEQSDWLSLASATYPAVVRITATDTIFSAGYNPQMAWQDHSYLSQNRTGSAEAATAMSSGIKTYSGAIGIGIYGDTLKHISAVAKELGKSTGVVTSVQISHATPAGFLAHNRSRNNYEEIATYMLFNTRADVIMGAGNPDYNNSAVAVESSDRYVGGRELWEQLKANDGRTTFTVNGASKSLLDANGNGQPDAWTLVQDLEEFRALATGNTPARVLGIPKVNTTLNQGREATGETMPFAQPFNQGVPKLTDLTKAAINVLSQNPNGFFVMIEGGAIDWAGHDNNMARMLEEQMDFNQAITAAIEWVEANSSWDETLIIVTSDHETGYLTGPNQPDIVGEAVGNKGKGNLPDFIWNSGDHTNMLVPFYAKGKGAELFKLFADETDPVRGPFIQNSEIPQALFLMWGRQ